MPYKTALEKLHVLDSPYEPCSESYLEELVRVAKRKGYIPDSDFETVLEDLLTSRVQFRALEAEISQLKIDAGNTTAIWNEAVKFKDERDRLRDAAEELLEVANLRGDNQLPHPADDPILWTARMVDAWDELEAALAAKGE